MARLTDKQKKLIIADRADGMSLRQLAKKYGLSATTIGRVCQGNPELVQMVADKKDENTADVLAYMDSKKAVVCEIIGKGLNVLTDEDKLRLATPAQITTALGTLIDKWAMIGGSPAETAKEDALSRSLKDMAEELDNDKR